MIAIRVSDEIKSLCPAFSGVAVSAKVKNSAINDVLWEKIEESVAGYRAVHALEDIKKNTAIAATRDAYKRLGKDPNRYRPSAEALCRRILRDLPLYHINTLVDIINLVSIKTGYSIGGFDADKVQGNILTLGVGKADDIYDAIGRGIMNIEGLPVYRDSLGGIGTPTSDEERTKLSEETTHLLAIINGYSGKEGLQEAVNLMQSLLQEFAEAENIEIIYF